ASAAGGSRRPRRGARGGGGAAPSVAFKQDAAGVEHELDPIAQVVLRPGELLGHLLSGGGGYGHAFQREPERVRADVLAGFVSPGRAREVYGVAFSTTAIDDSLEVDEAETARLRGAG